MIRSSGGQTTIPCVIEAPEVYVPRARYALEMLLHPLGCKPRWVGRDYLDDHGSGVYYGVNDRQIDPRAAVVIPLEESTLQYFYGRTAYPQEPAVWRSIDDQEVPVLFPLEGDEFDVVASTFFWLSGWQEHTVRRRDRHGRFPYRASLQHRWDLADRPMVDLYRQWLKQCLRSINVRLQERGWGGAQWAVCVTHDIDYLRKWRPGIIYRECIEYFLQNRRQVPVNRRWDRLRRVGSSAVRGRDPYRSSWEQMHSDEHGRGIGATHFVKTGAHGAYDVDGSSSTDYLQRRIDRLLADGFEIGLHPSYHAATHPEYMAREVAALETMTGRSIRAVRQHYLRYQHPLTMRLQVSSGFQIDASMGFAAHEGFRHGTCVPFRYFDIYENRSTNLWMFPLAVMDSTLFGYRELSPEEGIIETRKVLNACKIFGGVCVLLWHNIIHDPVDGHGYDRHFTTILDEICASEAFVGSLGDAFDRWVGNG